jgi:hypothetical protein
MNPYIQRVFDKTVQLFRNNPMVIAAYHSGSIGTDREDEFSDVDPVFVNKRESFIEFDTRLPSLFELAVAKSILCFVLIFLTTCTATAPHAHETGIALSQDMPLALGNTWVYQHTRYAGFNPSEVMTATRRITETVVGLSTADAYVIATIRREQSEEVLVSADVDALKVHPASSHHYWLVMDGTHVYRQESEPDVSRIEETGELILVLPLQVGEKWYLNQEMAALYPEMTVDSMLQKVQHKQSIDVPAGYFEGCFFMQEVIGGSIFARMFCPGIGWVDQRSDHSGTPFGWQETLIHCSIQE